MGQSIFLPTSDILTQWGGSGGYIWVDEYPTPNDADYNQDNSGAQVRDIFGFTGAVPSGAVIINVTLKYRAQKTGYGRTRAAIRVGSVIYESGNQDPGGSWLDISYDWALNPVTALAWKWYELMGLGPEANRLTGIGYGRGNTGLTPKAVFCSQCYLLAAWKNLSQPWIM